MAKGKRLRRSAASKEREAEEKALAKEQTERQLRRALSTADEQQERQEEEEVYAVDAVAESEKLARRKHLEKSGVFSRELKDQQRILDPLLPEGGMDSSDDENDVDDKEEAAGQMDREAAVSELKKLREKHRREKDESDDSDDDSESDSDDDDYLLGEADEDEGNEDGDATVSWGKHDYHISRKNQQANKKKPVNREQRLKMREEELQDQMEEEEEAQELEKERRSRLRKQDYLEDLVDDASAGSKKILGENSSRMLAEINEVLEGDNADDAKVKKAGKSKGQMLKAIMKESPELVALIDDLKEKLATVKNQVEPLLKKAKQGNFATQEGISYLEVKYHLLLSYCIDIVFYLMLKAGGKQVKDHPVINHLVELRVLIEQIKPIDDRMKYQLNKLVQLANATNLTAQMDRIDLQHRPNPGNLVRGSGANSQTKSQKVTFAEQDDSSDDDDDDDNDDDGAQLKHLVQDVGSEEQMESGSEEDSDDSEVKDMSENEEDNAVYVPPKIIPIEYDETGDKKLKKKQKELEKRLQRSQMVREIKAAMSDAPEQSYSIGTEQTRDPTLNRASRLAQEIEEHEMDSYKRARLSKKAKMDLAAKQNTPYDAMQEFNNLTDNTLSRLDEMLKDREETENTNKRVTLMQYIAADDDDEGDVMAEVNKHLDEGSARKSKGSAKKRSREEDDTNGKRKKSKRAAKAEDRIAEDEQLFSTSRRDEEGKIAADKEMMENRGLKRYKNKAKGKNPRKVLRNKFVDKTGDMRKMENLAKQRGSSKMLREVKSGVVRSKKISS